MDASLKIKATYIWLTLFTGLFLVSCSDETQEVKLFEKGRVGATACQTSIQNGDCVTFKDVSKNAYRVIQTFSGDLPATSSESNVEVTYNVRETYLTKLEVIFVGAWQTLKIPISDFVSDKGALPGYSKISFFLVLRSAEAAVTAARVWDW